MDYSKLKLLNGLNYSIELLNGFMGLLAEIDPEGKYNEEYKKIFIEASAKYGTTLPDLLMLIMQEGMEGFKELFNQVLEDDGKQD